MHNTEILQFNLKIPCIISLLSFTRYPVKEYCKRKNCVIPVVRNNHVSVL